MSARVLEALRDLEVEPLECADGMPTLRVPRERLGEAMTRLRERLGFETNTLVTAVDDYPDEPRFRIVWQLLSLRHGERVRLRCDVAEDDAWVPTVTHLWPGAGFFERECYDLFGVRFEGNPDLRRLMMPQGYTHHPLRKDFPHQGIEPDRLYREWDAQRRQDPTEVGS